MFGSFLLVSGKEKSMYNIEFEYSVPYSTPLSTNTDNNRLLFHQKGCLTITLILYLYLSVCTLYTNDATT